MNWLAHLYLSDPTPEFRLGNLLADLVNRKNRAALPASFQAGLRQHQLIDAFTDSHPIVHRSRARLKGDYHHTRGILIDIFYDHFLARNWSHYSPEPLEDFTNQIYTQIRNHPTKLPGEAQLALDYLIADDRLTSYCTIEGIESALNRLSQRLSSRMGRQFALERAVSELVECFTAFETDFTEFFPQLISHVKP